MARKNIWSNGGGVQSAAIAVLIYQGKLPMPDLAVIADTEYEASSTWDYMSNHIQPMLERIGLKIHRVKKSDFAKDDLYCQDSLLIPAFSKINGIDGKQPGFCSSHWKKTVVQRYVRSVFPDDKFNMWLGISTDESQRLRVNDGKWRNKYPLVEERLNRNDCMSIVINQGLPPPPRSSCYICPNRSAQEWRLLSDADFEKAVNIEKKIRENQDYIYLSRNYKPLARANFDDGYDGDLFGTCETGMCFT